MANLSMRLPDSKYLMLFFVLLILNAGICSARESETVLPHDTFTIESVVMNEARLINVYLPPAYDGTATAKYPVVYMPDGGIKEDFPHLANTIDTAIRAGDMQQIILVGIENTQRRRDMTGPTKVAEDRKIAPQVGGSAAFRAFIANELIPQIRGRYQVTDEAGIIGESAAGLFIVETFFLQPDLFDTYMAISPAIWWNDQELVRRAAERMRGRPGLNRNLYLTSADEEDIVPHVSRLARVLEENAPTGLNWQYVPRPDLRHNNIYRSVSPQVLIQYYPAQSLHIQSSPALDQ